MPFREQGREGGLRGGEPELAQPDDVGVGREPDDQRSPPAMAGRITIVSLSLTLVPRPSSTRTSSSLR